MPPLRVPDPPQGGPIGCSTPHAPLEGSFHVWPWGSLDTPPGGLSHATPLGGCCVTVHDPSPAHAGGSGHPCQGVSRTLTTIKLFPLHIQLVHLFHVLVKATQTGLGSADVELHAGALSAGKTHR